MTARHMPPPEPGSGPTWDEWRSSRAVVARLGSSRWSLSIGHWGRQLIAWNSSLLLLGIGEPLEKYGASGHPASPGTISTQGVTHHETRGHTGSRPVGFLMGTAVWGLAGRVTTQDQTPIGPKWWPSEWGPGDHAGQPIASRADRVKERVPTNPNGQGLFAGAGLRARHALAGQAAFQPDDPRLAHRRPERQEPGGLSRRPVQRRDRPDRHPARRPRAMSACGSTATTTFTTDSDDLSSAPRTDLRSSASKTWAFSSREASWSTWRRCAASTA